jgi:hypothetical protein
LRSADAAKFAKAEIFKVPTIGSWFCDSDVPLVRAAREIVASGNPEVAF